MPLRLILSLILVLICGNALPGEESAKSVRERENENEKKIKDYLALEKIDFEEHPLLENTGSFGTSIYVYLRGEENEGAQTGEAEIIIALPISYISESEEAGFSFEVMFNFMKKVLRRGGRGVMVAFLADEWEGRGNVAGYAGIRELCREFSENRQAVILYAALTGDDPQLEIINASRNYVTPVSVLKAFTAAREAEELSFDFESPYNFLYKAGLLKSEVPIEAAADEELDILYLRGAGGGGNAAAAEAEYAPDARARRIEQISEVFYQWAQNLDVSKNNLIKGAAKNYIPLQYKYKTFIISEIYITASTYITLLLLFFLCFTFLYKKRIQGAGLSRSRSLLIRAALILLFLFFTQVLFFDLALLFLMESFFITCFLSLYFIARALHPPHIKPLRLSAPRGGVSFFYAKLKELAALITLKDKILIFICLCISASPFALVIYDIVRVELDNYYNEARENKKSVLIKDIQAQGNAEDDDESAAAGKVSFKTESRLYLMRQVTLASFDCEEEPEYFTLSYIIDDDYEEDAARFFIYNSPVPYVISGRRIDFILGMYPPEDLSLEIDFSTELNGAFRAGVCYER